VVFAGKPPIDLFDEPYFNQVQQLVEFLAVCHAWVSLYSSEHVAELLR
jgi:hypothetical protein